MKMKLRIAILVSFLMTSYFASSQINTTIDFIKKVKHQETVSTFLTIDSSASLTALDKSQLRSTSEIKIIEKYYTLDNNMPITLIEKLESKGIYEKWMKQPAKILIDATGVTSFDSLGGVMQSVPHTDKYLEIASHRERNIFHSFLEINNDHLGALQEQGYEIDVLSDGSVEVGGQKGKLVYDETKKIQEITRNDENGEPISVITTKYITVKSIDPQHPNAEDVIPVYSKEVLKKVLPSGVCGQLIRIRHFENYEIENGSQTALRYSKTEQNKKKSNEILVYPNPVSDYLNILDYDESKSAISIYNLQGEIIRTLITSKQNIDISELPKGIYLIAIQSGGEKTISKFIKI